MKKILLLLTLGILALNLLSCRESNNENSTRIVNGKTLLGKPYHSIEVKNDTLTLKMEYNGVIKFNAARTLIKSISKGGYVSYSSNEKRLHAIPITGGIQYKLSDDKGMVQLDKGGKQFIARAVRDMIYLDSLKTTLRN